MIDARRELEEKIGEQDKLASEIKALRSRINLDGLSEDVGLYDKIKAMGTLYDKGAKGYKELFQTCGEVMGMIGFDRAEVADQEPEALLTEFANDPPGLHWPKEFKLTGMEIQRGIPVVIGAQQGVGKTSFAVNLALSAADRGLITFFYSLEMTPKQVWLKLYQCYLMKVHKTSKSFTVLSHEIKEPNSSELVAARDFAKEIKGNVKVIEAEGFGADKICTHLDIYAGKVGRYPDFVVVDYLQIVAPESHNWRRDKKEQVDYVVKTFKGKAKRTGSIFVELSQLNKLNSFRESSEILDAAAMALILSRKWEKEASEWSSEVKVSTVKSRFTHSLSSFLQIDGKSGALGV